MADETAPDPKPTRPPRDRGGRPELPPEERRARQLGVRLNDAEWEKLSPLAKERGIPPATYLRLVALETVPPAVPEVNREGLRQLTGLCANVNQIAARLNAGRIGELSGPDRALLDRVRAAALALQQGLVGRRTETAKRAAERAGEPA